MNQRIARCAFAVSSVLASINAFAQAALPAPTPGPLEIWYKAPLAGATVSGTLSADKCYVKGIGVTRVDFFLDSTPLNSDTAMADGMSCVLDTTKFANGIHQLKAVARNSAGATYNEIVSINISNAAAPPPTSGLTPPGSGPLDIWWKAPAAGQTVKGTLSLANCYIRGTGVTRVDFFLDSTPIGSDTVMADGMSCVLDTTKFANGPHQLRAVARNSAGATYNEVLAINIQNEGSTTPPPPPPSSSLPSTGTRALATFESIGLYWSPGTNPGAAGCQVKFRKAGDSAWRDGLAMWYDTRNSECRGSLVHLTPNTTYEVQFNLPGQAPSRALTAKTWSENFPIAKTITVPSGSSTLQVTESGTPNGYVLYTAAPGGSTIDVNNAQDFNVRINASYVILRGFTLRDARVNGVEVAGGHDIVIEGNDISNWGGSSGKTSAGGYTIGANMHSGIHARCSSSFNLERTVVQNNRIHHPRFGANSWSEGHPVGPNAIAYRNCGGNHVFRYNEFYSEAKRYFNDVIGGESNFSEKGMPNADSDVYGNKISHAWDDAIESEGANRNVRIWGNYMDQTATGVATTATTVGPVYIWRNVYDRSRHLELRSLDQDQRLYMFKSGNSSGGAGNGRRYVFHNTMLQAAPSGGATLTLGGGSGLVGSSSSEKLVNTVSRNNIWHIWKAGGSSVDAQGGTGNDIDYDLFNGNISDISGAERNGIVGVPVYAPGHGSGAGGLYQLAPGSRGYDKGQRIANFNDGFTGAAPDMGAHEGGAPAMRFGVRVSD